MDSAGAARGPVQQTIMADGQTGVLEFRDVRLPASARDRRGGRGPRARLPLDQLGAQPPRRDVLRAGRALPGSIGALHGGAPGLRPADRRLRGRRGAAQRRLHGLAGDAGALAGDPGAAGRCRRARRRARGSGRAARPLDAEDLVRRGADARLRPGHPGARRAGPAGGDRARAHLPRRAQPAHPRGDDRDPAGDDRREPHRGRRGRRGRTRSRAGAAPRRPGIPGATAPGWGASPGRAAGRRRSAAPA